MKYLQVHVVWSTLDVVVTVVHTVGCRRRHEIGLKNPSRCHSEETRGLAAWKEFDITTATGMIRKQWEDGHACCTVKLPIGGDPHELILTGPPQLPKHANAAGAG
jgi:hypothetical protein